MADNPTKIETLISAQQIGGRVGELGKTIAADFVQSSGVSPLHLIGVLKGSVVFLADLARAIERDVSFDFIGAGSYGNLTESSGSIRLTKDLDGEIQGRDVLLVEDIVDTGLTVNWLCSHLQQRGPRSLRVATLLDKPSRRIKPVKLDYVGFEIPDKFVVGYGLDYAGRYRNRPDICVLQNASL